ncbi:MAG TPA: GtrA family protein [Kofleriaceae bacterium]|nr:GtrA family protein [Kofleriaceae bacterium]
MTTTRTLMKSGVSGLAATCIDFAVLVSLVEVGHLHVAVAAFCGAAAGAAVNFVINKFWTFRCPRPIDAKQIGTFALVALGTCVLVAAAIQVLAVWLGVPYILAKVLASVAAFLFWTYPAQAKLVFFPGGRSPGASGAHGVPISRAVI